MKTYISGQTATADFAGIADAGLPVGVQVQEITPTVEAQIASYSSEGGFVFVDSGAFTAFVKGETVDFDQVLDDYERLASLTTTPANLAVVAPDAIGDMDLTAELQVAYLDRIKRLTSMGVELLLPLQRGWTNPQYLAHYRFIRQAIGPFTLAFAANKAAFEPQHVAELVVELEPERVHLLGVGTKNLAAYSDAVLWNSPNTEISSDANRVRVFIGEGRQITEEIEQGVKLAYQRELECEIDGTEEEGYIHNMPGYLSQAEARELARLFGVVDAAEIERWGRWSQEEASERFKSKHPASEEWEFGCKLGYMIEEVDPYGYLSQKFLHGRGQDELKEKLARLAAERQRSGIRRRVIAKVMTEDFQKRETVNSARAAQMILFSKVAAKPQSTAPAAKVISLAAKRKGTPLPSFAQMPLFAVAM
ncbi:hypothetical protein [Geomonas subterranea]|uniref:hypothetical protein n=1 Tax=Geomonas subterranea TaxID=2847989 RepID=UPI001CD6E99B|nr:hypothetical protein [Geomonas fuzhouensis]